MFDRLIQRLGGGPFAVPFVLGFYLILLWNMSVPMTGDQKVYLSIALEMRERGEWIIPYLFERANFLKPPLQYWTTLLGWKILGFSLFGLSLQPGLSSFFQFSPSWSKFFLFGPS
jgi:4-amino-4-deoxy-L-arabinose transferase-like glycosyltransferase